MSERRMKVSVEWMGTIAGDDLVGVVPHVEEDGLEAGREGVWKGSIKFDYSCQVTLQLSILHHGPSFSLSKGSQEEEMTVSARTDEQHPCSTMDEL